MESRLNELEAKISLAEDLLDALNRTVYRQQRQIDQLQQDILALRQQLQEVAPVGAAVPAAKFRRTTERAKYSTLAYAELEVSIGWRGNKDGVLAIYRVRSCIECESSYASLSPGRLPDRGSN